MAWLIESTNKKEINSKLMQIYDLIFHFFLNTLPVCLLLVCFRNRLDPDRAQHFNGPNQDPNCLTLMVFLKEIFEKVDFEKFSRQNFLEKKIPSMQGIKCFSAVEGSS